MFEINITVLVQAAHFFLVWWGLHRFLFKLLVKTVKAEQAAQYELESMLEQKKLFITEKQVQKKQAWQDFQLFFKQNIPTTLSAFFNLERAKRAPAPVVSSQEIMHKADELSEELVRRVGS